MVRRTDTEYTYDSRYRVEAIADANTGADQGVTAFAYLDNGLLHTLTDPEGNVTTFDYDRLDRLTKETNELGDERSFGYDAVGNLKSNADRNGRLTEYAYDSLNRLTTENWKQGTTLLHTISYGYNPAGDLTTATSNLPAQNPYSTLVYAYDDLGRVKTVSDSGTGARPDVVLESAYDAASRRTSLVAKIDGVTDFTNAYAYDALARMTQVKQSGTNVASKRVDFAYDAIGQFAAITRYADLAGAARVVTSTFSHDEMGRLTGLSHALAGASTLAYAWTYDTLNRVATFTDPDGQTTYSYDNTSQLVGANRPGTADDETYSYDTNGNRDYGGYDIEPNNQMANDGEYDYTYDDEGNRRTRSKSGEYTEYTWDHRNRLVAVDTWTSNAKTTKLQGVQYAYDSFDRRITKSVDGNGDGDLADAVDWGESFVYDGDHIALVFDQDGSLKSRYLHGPAIDQVLAEETVDSLGLSGEVYWQLAGDQARNTGQGVQDQKEQQKPGRCPRLHRGGPPPIPLHRGGKPSNLPREMPRRIHLREKCQKYEQVSGRSEPLGSVCRGANCQIRVDRQGQDAFHGPTLVLLPPIQLASNEEQVSGPKQGPCQDANTERREKRSPGKKQVPLPRKSTFFLR